MRVAITNKTNTGPAEVSVAPTMPETFRHWTAGLFVSVTLGSVSGIIGLALAFLTIVALIAPSTSLYMASTLLIGASFIFFGLAAHCLDKADAAEKAVRLENCREQLLGRVDAREVVVEGKT